MHMNVPFSVVVDRALRFVGVENEITNLFVLYFACSENIHLSYNSMMICESLKPMANFYNRKDSNVAIVKIINERNKTTTFNRNNKCLKILSINP